MSAFVFFTAFFSVFLTSVAQICLKKTMLSIEDQHSIFTNFISFCLSMCINKWFILGILLYIGSLVLWLIVLKKIEVSQAYPLSAMGLIFTSTFAFFFLHETISTAKIIGLMFIVVGIIFISRS